MSLYLRTPDGIELHHGNAPEVLRGLPRGSVDACVTSPPYWQLRQYEGVEPTVWERDEPAMRDVCHGDHEWEEISIGPAQWCVRCGAWRGLLGLEPTPDLFVEHLVAIFDEVRPTLKPTGSLWVNLGDSYVGGGHGPTGGSSTLRGKEGRALYEERQGFVDQKTPSAGLPEKSLAGVPERFVLAMQRRGWLYRERIVWHKLAHMPESVDDRCTRAHEDVFHFTLGPRYYGDMKAVRVPATPAQADHNERYAHEYATGVSAHGQPGNVNHKGLHERPGPGGHNLDTVWTLANEPSKVQHYAAYPRALATRPILISTSEYGVCSSCGAPWHRIVQTTRGHASGSGRSGRAPKGKNGRLQGGGSTLDVRNGPVVGYETLGWQQGCDCDADPVPATVLDPFVGSGTTVAAARALGRRAIGIDASLAYLPRAAARLATVNPSLFARVTE